MDIIEAFEQTIAEYAGAKYGVAVSSETNAIFLSLQYLKYIGELDKEEIMIIPSRTYISVPCTIKNCELNITFKDIKWSGSYQLIPTRIYDSAVRFTKNMYRGVLNNALYCISFQYRKALPIGRGGMILTDDRDAWVWLKQARFNGRHDGISQWDDNLDFAGWNMYMTPEDAARGMTLFSIIDKENEDIAGYKDYPDVSKQRIFK